MEKANLTFKKFFVDCRMGKWVFYEQRYTVMYFLLRGLTYPPHANLSMGAPRSMSPP